MDIAKFLITFGFTLQIIAIIFLLFKKSKKKTKTINQMPQNNIPQPNFCPNCGAHLENNNTNICPHCNNNFTITK